MLRPSGHVPICEDGLDLLTQAGGGSENRIGFGIEIDDRIGHKPHPEQGQHEDGHRQHDLRGRAADPSAPRHALEPVLEAAGGTLPVVALGIPRVRMPPGLQTALVDVFGGTFALAGPEETTGFGVG